MGNSKECVSCDTFCVLGDTKQRASPDFQHLLLIENKDILLIFSGIFENLGI